MLVKSKISIIVNIPLLNSIPFLPTIHEQPIGDNVGDALLKPLTMCEKEQHIKILFFSSPAHTCLLNNDLSHI